MGTNIQIKYGALSEQLLYNFKYILSTCPLHIIAGHILGTNPLNQQNTEYTLATKLYIFDRVHFRYRSSKFALHKKKS